MNLSPAWISDMCDHCVMALVDRMWRFARVFGVAFFCTVRASACYAKPRDGQPSTPGDTELKAGSDNQATVSSNEPSNPFGQFISFRVDGPLHESDNSPIALGVNYSFGYWVANNDALLLSAGLGPGLNLKKPIVPLLELPLRATLMTPGPASVSFEFSPTLARYRGHTYALGSVGVYYAILYVFDLGFSVQAPLSSGEREDWMRDLSLGLHVHLPVCLSRGRFQVRWGCL